MRIKGSFGLVLGFNSKSYIQHPRDLALVVHEKVLLSNRGKYSVHK